MTRRTLLATAAGAALAAGDRFKVCVFSKHFQWTDWKETAVLAAQLGFDGVDLTVREGGHVLPERVGEDLPRAVEILHQAGLETPMITAGIVDAASPHAERILRTASSLGIRYYRWGGFRYQPTKGIAEQLEEFRPKVEALAALNKAHKMCAMYHTHSGPGQVGASIWDLWVLLKGLDPWAVGVNYDIGHATVEGGYGDWITTTRLIAPYLRGTAIKDFRWGQNAKGEWVPQWCALGQGMVNFPRYFQMLREAQFTGPVQLHFEYPELGGADSGKSRMSISKDRFLGIMRRDLQVLRSCL
ncbi:MAG: sugar phosphate isomerase/epimerase [Candidatus Solibacter usitatus]|nr:sugar phosphate isomerase/epimerase [Candidatus Solibacter usitatus]